MNTETTEIHLREYLQVLKKRRWTVIAIFVIFVTLVSVYTLTSEPIYQATVQLLIERDNPKVVSIQEVLAIDATSTDYYQTQYELLKSDNLARRVVRRLNRNQVSFNSPGQSNRLIRSNQSDRESFAGEADPLRENKLIQLFQSDLKIRPKRNSRLVNVSFESSDPRYATEAVNILAEEYIKFSIETKVNASKEARSWLKKQVDDMRAKVEVSERAFEQFQQTIPKRIMAQVQSGKATREMENRPEVVHNVFIQELRTEEIKLSAKMADLSKKYGPKHPKIIRLASEREMIHDHMQVEIKRLVSAVMIEGSSEYLLLKREALTNQKLYEVLLTRLKETVLTENLPQSNIHIIDPAQVPQSPVKPNRKMNIFMASVFGLVFGAGVAFFFEYLDNTIHDPKDIEELLEIPFLGSVPSIKKGKTNPPIDLIVSRFPKSPQAEAYRTIRTGILFALAERQPKTILITSPGPLEGKTTTAANLAAAMAQSGSSVVLIDADLRKPRLHQIFSQDNSKGLSSVLVGEASLDGSITQTPIVLLSLLASGPLPPNPAELLGSNAMQELISELSRRYDRVIIDSPPCMPVTDSILLSRLCDGVVLVIKDSYTTKEQAIIVRRRISDAKAKILGGVLNDMNAAHKGYYYPYAHYGQDKERDRERA